MKPGKLALIVIGVLFALLLGSKLVTLAFGWISSPSDMGVLAGISTIVLLIGLGVFIVAKLVNRAKGGAEVPPDAKRLVLLLAIGATMSLSACTRVDVGHAGIKVDMYGKNRGVQDIPLVTGWVWYNPFSETVLQYPCYVQTAIWTESPHEGKAINEELSFNIKGGVIVRADISLSYQFVAEKVPAFYLKFRNDNIDVFTHGFLRNTARDAFNEIATGYDVDDLYGPKKEEMFIKVRERINREINPIGAHLEQFGATGALRFPPGIVEAMNLKAKATQDAITAENQLRQSTAEAQKVVAKAKGEAEANLTLAKSITPELLQWQTLQLQKEAIAKWDGKRPLVESGQGSGGLLMQIPMPELRK